MTEQIYTFTDEEVARMLKSGELKLLTAPEPVQKIPEKTKTEHEKALEKAKKLFGEDFKDVETLQIGGKSKDELKEELKSITGLSLSASAKDMINNPDFITFPTPQNIEIIKLKIKDLGFKIPVNTAVTYQKAQELGLELCPAEVALYLILKFQKEFFEDCPFTEIATKSILGSYFYLWGGPSSLWLLGAPVQPMLDYWNPGIMCIFSLTQTN